MQVHLAVEFPRHVVFDYRAERAVAEAFAADLSRWHSAALVTIDRAVTTTMHLLPCHRLYEA
ncbi:hypothetical protein [Nocardia salmonicida]|uniref:hypothetical protein n=1 Tax=Nocardia salmonicida TaxID=53431 RepID=UPI0012F4BA65|nr:hypothetical protein [Nocardia salmonicida]